jgi:hypothetical protein
VLWVVVLFLGFLLLGALRAVALLRWRLEQLEATTPSRLGRSGLRIGKKAPDFTLPGISGAPDVRRRRRRPLILVAPVFSLQYRDYWTVVSTECHFSFLHQDEEFYHATE